MMVFAAVSVNIGTVPAALGGAKNVIPFVFAVAAVPVLIGMANKVVTFHGPVARFSAKPASAAIITLVRLLNESERITVPATFPRIGIRIAPREVGIITDSVT